MNESLKKALKPLLFLLAFSFCTLDGYSQTTFILVRHAEKADDGTRNPPLNDGGKERSARLADLVKNQEVAALYSTPFKRTQETLEPLAEQKELEIKGYDPFAKDDWLETIIKQHTGGTVVICGHSNTIPSLANSLLGEDVFEQFEESDYSNLIIIVVEEMGKGKLVRLSF